MMSEKNCPYNHIKLVTYASGNASPSERSEVERHLATCPDCRQEMTELQKTWLALDLWQEEAESFQPRLNDLHLRLEQIKEEPSLWDRVCSSFPIRWENLRLAPTFTLASLVALLLLMPLIQSQMNGVQNQNNTDYGNEINAIPKDASSHVVDQQDQDSKQFVSNYSPNDNLEDYSNRTLQDQEHLENLFRFFSEEKPDTMGFTNVGYVPNANIPPAHHGSSQQPTALFQMTDNQTVRLNHQ